MRISDWSSDVCSSDLVRPHWRRRWQTPSYHWPNPPSGDSKRPAAGLPGWLIRRFCPSFKSMTQKNYYLTTPIYYANDKPHTGHAYTTAACDVVARFHGVAGCTGIFLNGHKPHAQQ